MFGPQALFPEGTYLSNADGTGKKYYAPIPWAGMVKTLMWALQIASLTANAQVKLGLQYTFDGSHWFDLSLLSDTSTTGWHSDDTSTSFGNRTRLVLEVSASSVSTIVGAGIGGAYLSGKPF